MKHPGFWIGAGLVTCVAIVAVAAPVLAPQDPYASSVDMTALPSAAHWLGTDDLGRDVLSRVIFGARASLAIGVGGAAVAMLIGVPIGLIAGTLRGATDVVLAALIDLFIALPGLVLALIITVMVGANLRNLILVLGFVMWPPIARLVRGQALALREAMFGGGSARDGRPDAMDHPAPYLARRSANRGSTVLHQRILRDLYIRQPEFLGPRHSPAGRGLGRHGACVLRLSGNQSVDQPGTRRSGQPDSNGVLHHRTLVPMNAAGR